MLYWAAPGGLGTHCVGFLQHILYVITKSRSWNLSKGHGTRSGLELSLYNFIWAAISSVPWDHFLVYYVTCF